MNQQSTFEEDNLLTKLLRKQKNEVGYSGKNIIRNNNFNISVLTSV